MKISNNNEKAIYFWVIIYEYVNGNFNSLYIIWDKHFKIIIEKNSNGNKKNLKIRCYHDIDIEDSSVSSDYIETEISLGEWNYIRCQADSKFGQFQLNNHKKTYFPATYKYYYSSSLKIKDTSSVNYGFSFIRELKLYSSYNFDFWDDSRIIFQKDSLPYLLHYFRFLRTTDDLFLEKVTDIIKEKSYNMPNLKEKKNGYNYVINYNELVLCNIGFCYEDQKCEFCSDSKCEIPKNKEKK